MTETCPKASGLTTRCDPSAIAIRFAPMARRNYTIIRRIRTNWKNRASDPTLKTIKAGLRAEMEKIVSATKSKP